VFRFILRRDAGSVGLTDFLFVVLLGDASQNAMIGEGTSTADGLVLVGTLVFWNYGLDVLGYRFRAVERFMAPPRRCLVRDGRLLRRQMRREFITTEELMMKVREGGLEDLSRIKAIYLEGNGELSVIKRDDGQSAGS